jgi:DNA (cytosine-5)-methyltransferase 1
MLFVLYSAESPGDHQREIRYLSVCSGIEAATVAWHPLGWKPFAFAEIEKFPSAVLAHHYPHVPNLGDITKFKEWPDATIDLLVGGTPCQSFSVAGLRKGLADPRGNLALTYCAILNKYRPRWFVWENVPGVLSVDGGRAFGSILGAVAELGYGFAWRVLDAQYVRVDGFGRAVPQRRRRVFVVGHLGDWRRAAAVLFERESLRGHSPPRREAGQRVAPTISSRPTGGGGLGTDFDLDGGLIPAISHPLLAKANDSFDDTNLAFGLIDVHATLDSNNGSRRHNGVISAWAVRRLTPTECERLQAFRDGYTDIPWRGKANAPDGPRYKALGNSMAVNVMRWIGWRIQMVRALVGDARA